MKPVDLERPLRTDRLELIPAQAESLRADLEGRDALARALCVYIPASWPPDLYDEDAIHFFLARLSGEGASAGWGSYYIVGHFPGEGGKVAIGVGGFKGKPDDSGTVEIGYSLLPEFQHRGFAVEAVRGWLNFAFQHGTVERVIAHTLANLQSSIRVLDRTGFSNAGRGDESGALPGEVVVRYEISKRQSRP